jgi:hypothetical protein
MLVGASTYQPTSRQFPEDAKVRKEPLTRADNFRLCMRCSTLTIRVVCSMTKRYETSRSFSNPPALLIVASGAGSTYRLRSDFLERGMTVAPVMIPT